MDTVFGVGYSLILVHTVVIKPVYLLLPYLQCLSAAEQLWPFYIGDRFCCLLFAQYPALVF